jgi:hypothetical protein
MLARTLGRTLDELGRTMSAAEFADHLADYLREPWGDRRADLQAALVSHTVATFAGKTLKDGAPPPLSDFLLDFNREAKAPAEPDPASFFGQLLKD